MADYRLSHQFSLRSYKRAGQLMTKLVGQIAIPAEVSGIDPMKNPAVGDVIDFQRDSQGMAPASRCACAARCCQTSTLCPMRSNSAGAPAGVDWRSRCSRDRRGLNDNNHILMFVRFWPSLPTTLQARLSLRPPLQRPTGDPR